MFSQIALFPAYKTDINELKQTIQTTTGTNKHKSGTMDTMDAMDNLKITDEPIITTGTLQEILAN